MSRVFALWLPDWPVQAARLAGVLDSQPTAPVALCLQGEISVCSPAARRAGVRRGQSRRQAQALCPGLGLAEADEGRDSAEFESVVQRLEAIAAGVETLRPGLAVVAGGGAARYYGGEDIALEKLVDAAAVPGVDCMVGAADDIVTAILAARRGILVPEGAGAGFRAGVSLAELCAEASLGLPADLARAWSELGLRTLGDVAAVPKRAVANRFGARGARWHDVAVRGEARLVAPRSLPADLAVVHGAWESPLQRVDEASFVARSLAVRLHDVLAEHGFSCYRLLIEAQFDDSTQVRRVWRCAEPLSERATADRVRWQLDGWLNTRAASEEAEGRGIVELRLEPMDVVTAGLVRQDLWRGGDAAAARARRSAERVQGLLGTDAVSRPVLRGGRGPGERIEYLTFGESREPRGGCAESAWLGAIPAPNPSVVRAGAEMGAEVQLCDCRGDPVGVTGRATVTSAPRTLHVEGIEYHVESWAGPWPIDERWWVPDEARRAARIQVQAVAPNGDVRAMLLIGRRGLWSVEGIYD